MVHTVQYSKDILIESREESAIGLRKGYNATPFLMMGHRGRANAIRSKPIA